MDDSISGLANDLDLSPHSLHLLNAVVYAINSGEVELPFSQEEAEVALVATGTISPLVDLVFAYPEFLQTAKDFVISQGYDIN